MVSTTFYPRSESLYLKLNIDLLPEVTDNRLQRELRNCPNGVGEDYMY